MSKKFISAVILFSILWGSSYGQSDVAETHLERANQLYLTNDFAGARDEYLKIVSSGYESAELYYNLGSTYYKLSQIPSAILYLERAHLLNPKDEDILFNLKLANQLVVDKINPVKEFFLISWVRSLAAIARPDVWAIVSLVALILVLILIVIYYAARGYRLQKSGLILAFTLLFVLAISLFLGAVQNRRINHANYAIVFSPSITAKSAPDNSGTDLFVLHEGLKVKIKDRMGSWLRIRLPDGNEAWVPETAVEKI